MLFYFKFKGKNERTDHIVTLFNKNHANFSKTLKMFLQT